MFTVLLRQSWKNTTMSIGSGKQMTLCDQCGNQLNDDEEYQELDICSECNHGLDKMADEL